MEARIKRYNVNDADGSVELIVEGAKDTLDFYLDKPDTLVNGQEKTLKVLEKIESKL